MNERKVKPEKPVEKKPRAKRPPKQKCEETIDLVQSRSDFVRNLIAQDFKDAPGAYRRAYPNASGPTASVEACRLLKDPNIQEAISTELKAVIAEKRVPLEKRILDTWIVRAFYDPTEIIGLDGALKISNSELRKRGLQVCIDSINKKRDKSGDEYVEYKLADRDKALDMLQKYISMIREPDKTLNVNMNSGVLRIPSKMTPEEWEAAALAQQGVIMAAGLHD